MVVSVTAKVENQSGQNSIGSSHGACSDAFHIYTEFQYRVISQVRLIDRDNCLSRKVDRLYRTLRLVLSN